MAAPTFVDGEKVHIRSTPKRMGPASIAAKALNPRHRKFADLVLSGVPSGVAYHQVFNSKDRDVADACAATLLGRPRVASYISAVTDQAVANVVLSQEVLHGHAMAIARGGDAIGPGMQMEAIRYLDGCLNRNRTIRVEGLTLRLDVDEGHVAAIAYAALEAEAKGEMGSEDARHLIESAAMVQQIMHGRTIARDMDANAGFQLPKLPPPNGSVGGNGTQHSSGNGANGKGGNGHTVGGNGASAIEPVGNVTQHANGDVTMALADPRPVRPKWLKTPEQIAAQAKTRSDAAKGNTNARKKTTEEKS